MKNLRNFIITVVAFFCANVFASKLVVVNMSKTNIKAQISFSGGQEGDFSLGGPLVIKQKFEHDLGQDKFVSIIWEDSWGKRFSINISSSAPLRNGGKLMISNDGDYMYDTGRGVMFGQAKEVK
jgi:hypothetical protein